MPGLVRKLLIFATVDGLVLQAHGHSDHHKPICLDYKTLRVSEWTKPNSFVGEKAVGLESQGLVGLITIASLSYLIAVTRREQVAQIYGKPVYMIRDVTLLPLSSQEDADAAIRSAGNAHLENSVPSDSEDSDSGSSSEEPSKTTQEVVAPPQEDIKPMQHANRSGTSIAEDVATRKASYGLFASRWFSKRAWAAKTPADRPESGLSTAKTAEEPAAVTNATPVADAGDELLQEPTTGQDKASRESAKGSQYPATAALLPKILKSTKMILSSGSFFFSYEFDLTRRLALLEGKSPPPTVANANPLYLWNRRLGASLIESGHEPFFTPIIQGFVGQRTFSLKRTGDGNATVSTAEETPGETLQGTSKPPETTDEGSFLLTLVSRRSVKRSGLRYLRRGIDDEGHCANSVESEQILSSPDWDTSRKTRAFVQYRGSVPLYFSQSPYSFKPIVVFDHSAQANETAFRKHFHALRKEYGEVQVAMLVNKHGTELPIGNAYEHQYDSVKDTNTFNQVEFEWFDFHAECRGMRFENVQLLVDKLKDKIDAWGETIVSTGKIESRQSGIIRTNCMDCLDRTNVAESAFGQYVLQKALQKEGYQIDLIHDDTTSWFNTLWADNGDAISRQYASTAALKGDYTRTRKRNWRGAMNDFGLTLSRYYSNMVNDYFSQAVIDMLLGNVSWKVFEDFETTLKSADPGISVQSAREAAIEKCAKLVIQGEQEDLMHGWTVSVPAQENTLRTLPFEEAVLLLTDVAIYCCKFDWSTEKVARFEKVDLQSMVKIRHGAYVTSTFTETQLDESVNQGLLIRYSPGTHDTVRVNTRSLSNSEDSEQSSAAPVDGGTGMLSWLAPLNTAHPDRILAVKVIPQHMEDTGTDASRTGETPRQLAERICDEIRRATVGAVSQGSNDTDLIEQGDIITASEARKRTGYLEQIGHSLKRLVWA